jgi:Na+/H+-dicarboxylate symporter
LSLVLSPIGLPIDDYIIFLPFEWLRGRFSTTVNVLGELHCSMGVWQGVAMDSLKYR